MINKHHSLFLFSLTDNWLNYFSEFSHPATCVVAGLFLFSSLAGIFYFIYFFSQAGKQCKKKIRLNSLPAVTVIVCARNEEDNIRRNLPSILKQDYPVYEVVVVDDCSDDNTQDVLRAFCKEYKHLKYTTIKKDTKFTHSKKLALTVGIKAASHEHLLFTDADCYPVSNQWIKRMASNYKKNTEIVIAYGAYETLPGFINKLIRYEAVFTAMQYFGFAQRGFPYMGVGRNLSYRRSLFFRNKGFASHISLDSGDDDLFISETANNNNLAIETHPSSFTRSIPEKTLKGWLRQRKRHFTTGPLYRNKIKVILGAEYFMRTVHVLCFIYLIIKGFILPFVLLLFFLTLITKGIIYKVVLRRLEEKYLFIFSLIIEPLIPYFYGIIHILNFFERKHSRWN